MMQIDAHQHFWRLDRGDYAWITPDLVPLRRDYGPADLAPLRQACGIDGSIAVQAAPSLAETQYLLDLADADPAILGVVGWVDFDSALAPGDLAALAGRRKFVGLRPLLQDIADPQWVLRPQFAPVFEAALAHGLTFDALIRPGQLDAIAQLCRRYPDLAVVIDHGAKPDIAGGGFDQWAGAIAQFADLRQCHCKLSGLWTEAGDDISAGAIAPYVRHVIDVFGPRRVMWGSDWPVIRLAGEYADWHTQCQALLADLGPADLAAIFGGTAAQFYGI